MRCLFHQVRQRRQRVRALGWTIITRVDLTGYNCTLLSPIRLLALLFRLEVGRGSGEPLAHRFIRLYAPLRFLHIPCYRFMEIVHRPCWRHGLCVGL